MFVWAGRVGFVPVPLPSADIHVHAEAVATAAPKISLAVDVQVIYSATHKVVIQAPLLYEFGQVHSLSMAVHVRVIYFIL